MRVYVGADESLNGYLVPYVRLSGPCLCMMEQMRYHFLQVQSLEEVPVPYLPQGLTNLCVRAVRSLRGFLTSML